MVQKYNTEAGDTFYFRPRDGQFVLVDRRKALVLAVAPEPNIEAFSYDDRITVSRPLPQSETLPQGEPLGNRSFLENIGAQQALAITADGGMLAGGDANGVVSVWNLLTRSLELQLNKSSGIQSLAFSPDGNSLAIGLAKPTGEASDTVWIHDIHNNGPYHSFGRNAVLALAWSPDGRFCGAGLDDGSVLLGETSADREPRRIVLATSPVSSLDFHPSGLFVASAHADKRIRIAKVPTGELLFTFEPALSPNPLFPRGVEHVAFDRTGARFAAAYAEGGMRIWDASTLSRAIKR